MSIHIKITNLDLSNLLFVVQTWTTSKNLVSYVLFFDQGCKFLCVPTLKNFMYTPAWREYYTWNILRILSERSEP